MPAQAKLLIGLLATIVVTWLWLQPFGQAAAIAEDLEQRASETLASHGAANVDIAVQSDPVRRVIELDGEIGNSERGELRDAVMALSGVSDVVWPEADPAEIEQAAAIENSAAQDCRETVETAIGGERIQFRSGSPYLNPAAHRLLDRIAEAADGCEGIRIAITGHANSSGRANVNNEMSAFRATTVRDALVERGLPAEMLTTAGRGSGEPLGGNPADPENRRVDFEVSLADGEAG
ncbi:OmpA family protein [Parasphingopyxis sp.]|uniref:OmpA family protein n=1 Tax=Parasphingopyxis sp. TaxID=1920299 RepID=UPI002628816B|nr:OmpA family protein [Parasphingopyxis sp.]